MKLLSKSVPRSQAFMVWLVVFMVLALSVSVVIFSVYQVSNNVKPVQDTSNLANTEPDVKPEELIANLNNPIGVAFPSTSTIYYGVRAGEIRGRDLNNPINDWSLLKPADIYTEKNNGLISILADKDFKNNRYLFACYKINAANTKQLRVTRYKISEDLRSVVDAKNIISGIESSPSSESSCTMVMDNAFMIWIGTGDPEAQYAPQDKRSLSGKILRVTRDGLGAPKNLSAPFDDRIFSYGHRNVSGIILLNRILENGAYGYSIDRGSSAGDEINYLMAGNFGYGMDKQLYSSFLPKTTNPTSSTSTTSTTNTTSSSDTSQLEKPIWSSGAGLGLIGGAIVKGERWQSWENKMLVAAPTSGRLYKVEFNDKGEFVKSEATLEDFTGRLNSLIEGPNNSYYATTDNGSPDKVLQFKVICSVCK